MLDKDSEVAVRMRDGESKSVRGRQSLCPFARLLVVVCLPTDQLCLCCGESEESRSSQSVIYRESYGGVMSCGGGAGVQ